MAAISASQVLISSGSKCNYTPISISMIFHVTAFAANTSRDNVILLICIQKSEPAKQTLARLILDAVLRALIHPLATPRKWQH